MSLAVDIRYLTIPFTLLIAKIGIAKGKGNVEEKRGRGNNSKKDNKGNNKKGGCGCRMIGGSDIPFHGSQLIDTINSLKNV